MGFPWPPLVAKPGSWLDASPPDKSMQFIACILIRIILRVFNIQIIYCLKYGAYMPATYHTKVKSHKHVPRTIHLQSPPIASVQKL